MRDLLELLRSDEVQDIGYVFGDSCARSRHHQASRVERQQCLFASRQFTKSITLDVCWVYSFGTRVAARPACTL